jgi:hypothetical protein
MAHGGLSTTGLHHIHQESVMANAAKKSGFPTQLVIGFAIVTIAGAVVTNPSEAAYLNYATGQFGDRFESLCDEIKLPEVLGGLKDMAQETCSAAASAGRDLTIGGQSPVATAIGAATERQNFLVCSLYKTQVLNQTVTTIGAFGQFVSLPSNL